MNLTMAEKLNFEYYVTDMDQAGKALPTCTLELRSGLVCGSWYAKMAHEFKRHPTLI